MTDAVDERREVVGSNAVTGSAHGLGVRARATRRGMVVYETRRRATIRVLSLFAGQGEQSRHSSSLVRRRVASTRAPALERAHVWEPNLRAHDPTLHRYSRYSHPSPGRARPVAPAPVSAAAGFRVSRVRSSRSRRSFFLPRVSPTSAPDRQVVVSLCFLRSF